MAEITTPNSNNHKKGIHRSKKLSTKVDLTPMVDLGFLLITFFVFTTSMTVPKVFTLHMPKGETPTTNVGQSAALTIIPGNNNQAFYFHGDLKDALISGAYGFTNYNVQSGLGEIIRQKKKMMEQTKPGFSKDLTLIIYPTANATYQNIIAVLDERAINAVEHYALVDNMKELVVDLRQKGILEPDF